MKRKYLAGAACAAVLVTVGLLQKRSTVEAAGVQAPRFEVDPLWPKPLPNHWVIGADHRRRGRWQGQRVDHPPRRLARSEGKVRHLEAACSRMLRRRAGRPSVQSGGRPDRFLGRTRPGIRLAVIEPRHRRRLQRQRLDRRQRPRPAACRPRSR